MSEVTQRIVAAYEALGRAVQESLTGNGSEAVPEPTPEPDEFKHIDEDGDALSVRPQRPEQPEWLIVGCHARGDEDPAQVRLRPHDVNRLAQYLDQHRTDQDVTAVQQTFCAGNHPGCEADRTGCPHDRSDHGALGCVAYPECPCLRRGGR